MKKRKGFTLVELIVVIAIIAILAAIAVPRVSNFVDDAKEARLKSDFATMYSSSVALNTHWIMEEFKLIQDRNNLQNANLGMISSYSPNVPGKDDGFFMPTSIELNTGSNMLGGELKKGTSNPMISSDKPYDNLYLFYINDYEKTKWDVYFLAESTSTTVEYILIYYNGYVTVNGSDLIKLPDQINPSGFFINLETYEVGA